MSEQNMREPYLLHCPLCDHEVRVSEDAGDMCPYCGAQLDAFPDPDSAQRFTEDAKAREESARFRQVQNGDYWVVGHKSSPPGGRLS